MLVVEMLACPRLSLTTFRSAASLRWLPAVWRSQCVEACSMCAAASSKAGPCARSGAAVIAIDREWAHVTLARANAAAHDLADI